MPTIKLVTKSDKKIQQLVLPVTSKAKVLSSAVFQKPISQATLKLFKAESKPGLASRIGHEGFAVLAIGAGEALRTPADFRDFGGSAARSVNAESPALVDAEPKNAEQLDALVEGLLLGNHKLTRYKTAKNDADFQILVEPQLAKHNIKPAIALAEKVNLARDLINTPANDLWPDLFAKSAAKHAKNLGIKVEVWDEKRLEKEKCGGICAVGRGSHRPPRLVKLSYGKSGPKIAIVGKGITFDTGGLSLKPAESMVGMKYDMAGAATAMSALLAIAEKKLAVRVDAYLCLAENMPGGSATRPGDVITIRNGKTVEVLNTDAEGRLVMADGLSLAMETDPDHVIDIATLTGAASIALGNRYAGVMGEGDAVKRMLKAAEHAGEQLWQMPMPAELRGLLDSEIADIANVKIGNRAGGMLIAAHFLAEFVKGGKKPLSWAHLDIAGPGNNAGAPYGSTPSGASGAMLRTLVTMVEQLQPRR